jgi:predicted nucleic acid-binding protein
MPRELLDTSVLISHWRRCSESRLSDKTPEDASQWAETVIDLRRTRWIASPVLIEFVAGVRSSHELELAHAYLGRFEVIDRGNVSKTCWEEARKIAERVPRDGKPRQLGDCLLKAIAKHFKCAVVSLDKGF